MRELLYEIKQLTEGRMLNLHRHMLRVKYDAVLIIIYIRRILEAPATLIHRNADNAVVVSCRMVQAACIAFILHTEQAFWVSALLCQLRCRNGLWILLRLR